MSAATSRVATTTSPNAPAGRRTTSRSEREAGAHARELHAGLRDLDGDGHQRPCSARMRGSRKRYERSASRLQVTNRIATTSTPPRTIG